jgi:hypothetical protein
LSTALDVGMADRDARGSRSGPFFEPRACAKPTIPL